MRLGGIWAAALAVISAALFAVPVEAAQDSGWVRNDQGALRLVSAVTATGDAGRVQLGLEFHLKPGWKIYWRSPGDAGLPPQIDWKGSDNLADAVISWPAPHRFSISGLETMGYKDEVTLPIVVRLADPAQPLSLKASVDYLTCEVLCVPQHADLSLDLPAGNAEPTEHAHLIGRYLARVPGDGAAQGIGLIAAEAMRNGHLRVTVSATPPLTAPDLFIERADQMQFAKPIVHLEQGGRRVVFEAAPIANTGEGDLFEKPLTLSVVDGDRGMEVDTEVSKAAPAIPFDQLLEMIGVALLGGFILNLMPCVLPVLSLKVLGLISQSGQERRVIRLGFLASAAGILASFMVLAAGAIAVKSAGAAVGWGIQFQQPLFLVAMVAVVTLFAANLFGFFEIALPQWASGLGGGGSEDGPHLAGHFWAGAFATLLATPCSAPFLGTAVGFALANGAQEIVSIFAALGIGMAGPYLLIAIWPGLARMLPRPGRWMITLRRILGLVLAGTAIWLLAVLAAEAGGQRALAIAGLMLLALLGLAAAGRLPGRWRPVARLALPVVAIAGALLLASAGGRLPRDALEAKLHDLWLPFDKEVIAQQVSDGKVVFVDVTADWCITCQVNKTTVVYRGKVAARLATPGVVAMEADWTRPNDEIAAYLASFGRYGIPFNAVYGPGAPNGIPLPELLTEDAVLKAIDKAAKPVS